MRVILLSELGSQIFMLLAFTAVEQVEYAFSAVIDEGVANVTAALKACMYTSGFSSLCT